MTCRELAEFLWMYVSGEIAALQRREFDRHLAVCDACVAYVRSYEETIREGRDAFADCEDDVPEDVPAELVQAILTARQSSGATDGATTPQGDAR